MYKNWFLFVLKVKEYKFAVKILEKEDFHAENGGFIL